MVRKIMIFLNVIVLLFYLTIYMFIEPLLQIAGYVETGAFLFSMLRFVLLIIIGFCIGNLSQVFTRKAYEKTYLDIGSFFKISLIPILFLISINLNFIMNFVLNLPLIRERSAEIFYYIISIRPIMIIWIGFGLGSSIKFPDIKAGERV